MHLSVSRVGEHHLVKIPGPRLDSTVSPEFRNGMVDLIEHVVSSILLDFSAVDFIDSSGLGAVVGCYKHLGPRGRLELACLRPAVAKVFALTRMDRVFRIHDEVPSI